MPVFSGVGAVLIGQGVVVSRRLGVVGFWWTSGVLGTLAVVAFCAAFRSSTRVGPAGITVCRGFGWRGRTYPWREIRWIDIRASSNQYGASRMAQMTLADGRRRLLPALQDSPQYPQPTFDADFHRVVNWWKLSTDPGERFLPPDTKRRASTVIGVIVGLVMIGTVVLVVFRAQ